MLAELVAQLVGLDLVDPLVHATSRSPYSRISFAAVFSPTPGTPGMLSVGSPLSAL